MLNNQSCQAVLPSDIDGGGHSDKKDDTKKGVGVEDLDGTGVKVAKDGVLDPEKNKTIFMNLINVDEKAQTAALKDYYDNMTDEDTYEKKIRQYEFFSKRISPMLALTFVGIYW